jgi:hypothetical protein
MITNEQKVKMQHYVPRVYLKNFSKNNVKECYVYCFDKQNNKSFQTNIKDIAFEKEFYDKISEEQTTEKTLRAIETEVGGVIPKLLKIKDIDKLSNEEKDILSEFIAYQMIRVKETRETLKDTAKQFFKKYEDQLAPELKNQVLDSMKEESLRNIHKDIIGEMNEFKKRIKNMKWILVINKSRFPFWTSDNPVAEYNAIDLSPYGNIGLECLGFEMHIPIHPKIVLIICDPRTFSHEPNNKVIRDYRQVVRERDYQVRYSTRFIFSNESNFSFAQMMLRENPKIGDQERKRVTIN